MVGPGEQLSDSLEDYLEAIFHIEMKKNAARAKDIAERMQVSNSSVTGALRVLSEKGLVNYAPYDIITLTPRGKEVAQRVVKRHRVLCDFLVNILGVEHVEAEATACKMEHGVSKPVLERLKAFSDFIEHCPPECRAWLDSFKTREIL